jgi:hypothetical protein
MPDFSPTLLGLCVTMTFLAQASDQVAPGIAFGVATVVAALAHLAEDYSGRVK